MKQLTAFCLVLVVLLAPIGELMPQALAQHWVWGRQGTGSGIDSWSVAADKWGNVYGAGFSIGTTPINFGSGVTVPNIGAQGIWVKYDPSGNALWGGSTTSGDIYIINIVTDHAGNLIILGSYASRSMQIGSYTFNRPAWPHAAPYWLAKFSPSGTLLWALSEGAAAASLGGVAVDTADNIYVTGCFQSTFATVGTDTVWNYDATGNSEDILVARYTPAGSPVWVSRIGGNDADFASGITVTANGYVYIDGSFRSDTMEVDTCALTDPYRLTYKDRIFIAKFSLAGTPLWGQAAGGPGGADAFGGITSDANSNVFVLGAFKDNDITFGSMTLTPFYPGSIGKWDACLAEYSGDVPVWGRAMSSPSQYVIVYSAAVNPCGQIWVSGKYGEDAKLDTGITLAALPETNLSYKIDMGFLAGFNIGGSFAGDFAFSGTCGEDENGMAFDPNGNMFFVGDYAVTVVPFAFGPDTLTTPVQETFYMAKYAVPAPDTSYRRSDTVTCEDSSGIKITAPAGFASYVWNDGATGAVRTVPAGGQYLVTCISCGSVLIDTIDLSISAADTANGKTSVALCGPGATVALAPPAGYAANLWSTGSSSGAITVSLPGTYWVNAYKGCSLFADTFAVALVVPPVVAVASDTIFCSGASATLSSPQPSGSRFLWSTGSTQPFITVYDPGTYWLRVIDSAGCSVTDSANVVLSAAPAGNSLTHVSTDATIAFGSSIQLNAGGEKLYFWKPDDGSLSNTNINNPIATPVQTTVYTVFGYNDHNCLDSASVTIYVDTALGDCIPNAFTPNGDGLNDIFKPSCEQFRQLVEFRVYNRWGQQVFFSNSFDRGWDGTFNGVPQDIGAYYYCITLARPGGANAFYKGDVTLIR